MMNRKRSNRSPRTSSVVVPMDEILMDAPAPDAKRSARAPRPQSAGVAPENEPFSLREEDIDAMLAKNSHDAPPVSARSSRRKKKVSIASNPSVDPRKNGSVVLVDGLRVASSRIHKSVEDEARQKGIKLPPGVRSEDLELPSYHNIVVSERHELPESLYFQEDIQKKLESVLPSIRGEKSEKRAKSERGQKRERGEKGEKGERGERGEKTPKPGREEKGEKSEGKKHKKSGRGGDRKKPVQEGTPVPGDAPTQSPAPVVVAPSIAPAPATLPVSGLTREELLVKQKLAMEMLLESQRIMAEIQTRLLAVDESALAPLVPTPIVPPIVPPADVVVPTTPPPAPEDKQQKGRSKRSKKDENAQISKMDAPTQEHTFGRYLDEERAPKEPQTLKEAKTQRPAPALEVSREREAPTQEKPLVQDESATKKIRPEKESKREQKTPPAPNKRASEERSPSKAEKRQLSPAFRKMGLSREILFALADAQYDTPSNIQLAFIPEVLSGRDVMGQAQTGTGKTAAFAIPILQMMEFDEDCFDPQALILAPTRELAVQVRDEFEKLAKYTDLESVALYGGKPLPPQVQVLRQGVDIVVGTPGRVMDHINRGSLKLGRLKIVVLDEADRMLDIGFRPDIEKILRAAPQSRQTLLLSATIPPAVESIARKYMREPKILDCSHQDIASETIEQFYFTVEPDQKFELLERLLEREQPKQAIIFCRTKRGTEKVATRLGKVMQGVASIHGDLQQKRRDRVMDSFRAGKTRYLIATDVVGRGIDVSNISHIINYDIPKFCDDYVHRVGRTGRMGREGVAFTFVAPEEGNELTRIEMRINRLLQRDELPGFRSTKPLLSQESAEVPMDDGGVKESDARRTRRNRKAF
ncbi:MAG: DEAD/DEAH box helicase [Planctomycetia bacterium]|nr:DEAD/DEAH box helicase [Planctomycetia bacterium]